MAKKILLVDDEPFIVKVVETRLAANGYDVVTATDGQEGFNKARSENPDLIILDVMLPGKDGVAVCREIRDRGNETPILMLTAKGELKDKVTGLNAGADDYLLKPFEFEELLARSRALLRRKTANRDTVLKAGDLTLDQMTHEVSRAGKRIELTSREYALLQYLMHHAGQVVTRTMISEHVWNEHFDSFTNVIDVYIKYLRDKIDQGSDTPLIQTIRGTGYMLKGPEHDASDN